MFYFASDNIDCTNTISEGAFSDNYVLKTVNIMGVKHIGVAAFKKKRVIGYYIDRIHTAKDVIFDEKNIAIILEGLRNFVKGDKNEFAIKRGLFCSFIYFSF